MNPLFLIVYEIIYRPIFNLLLVLLSIFDANLGLSIIVLTLIIRLLLLKPSLAGNKMQQHMTDLQPKLKEIQEKYKDDQQKLAEETMKVFKNKGTGPLKGCIMLLVQIPVFIGLFFVIRAFSGANDNGGQLNQENIYSFLDFFNFGITNVESINSTFLGIDLLTSGNIALAIIAPILLFLQIKLTMMNKPATPTSMPGAENMPDMGKMMEYMHYGLIAMMAVFIYSMPSGIGLYITTTTLFSLVQYSIQYKELLKAKLSNYMNK